MRARSFVALSLLFCGTSFAQNFYPKKDLAFGQIAAGGGYESVITVTNRGTTIYLGTLELYRRDPDTGSMVPWNPTINGTILTSGMLDISLNPGETKTYRIILDGDTQSAYGFITSSDMNQTSFIEGNLTYYVSSVEQTEAPAKQPQPSFANGNSLPIEGVGVPPSTEFYKTTIPFDDFSTVALALASANVGPSANVNLTVFDAAGQQSGTIPIQIGPFEHYVKYLWQEFPSLTLGAGRLDIESDRPIFGTALLFVPGASGSIFSSLPLPPSLYTYSFSALIEGQVVEGTIGLWVEGPFLNGYVRTTKAFGLPIVPETFLFLGQLQNRNIWGATYGESILAAGGEMGSFIDIRSFDFSQSSASGHVRIGNAQTGEMDEGTIVITKIF